MRAIAIGSTNVAKVRAVTEAVAQVWPDARLVPVSTPSGVSEMPSSDDEGIRGAVKRAHGARDYLDADLGIGLEGAVDETSWGMVVTNWVAVVDRSGRASVACGGRLPLPECIAAEIRAGAELGPVIDRYTGQAGTKQHAGAAGYLTRGIVPRHMAFHVAVAFALAPYLHPELYDAAPQ